MVGRGLLMALRYVQTDKAANELLKENKELKQVIADQQATIEQFEKAARTPSMARTPLSEQTDSTKPKA